MFYSKNVEREWEVQCNMNYCYMSPTDPGYGRGPQICFAQNAKLYPFFSLSVVEIGDPGTATAYR